MDELVEHIITKYEIVKQDLTRPWGGFYCISPTDTQKFVTEYFSELDIDVTQNISPKILIVAPHQKLSWQYHHRRQEIWKVLKGPVGVVKSSTDTESQLTPVETGDIIRIEALERHRLIGLDDFGLVAELWCHTNKDYLSDEDDIVRVQDDYNRL